MGRFTWPGGKKKVRQDVHSILCLSPRVCVLESWHLDTSLRWALQGRNLEWRVESEIFKCFHQQQLSWWDGVSRSPVDLFQSSFEFPFSNPFQSPTPVFSDFFSQTSRWWFQRFFNVHPYLGKFSNLTNIFQRGWNHQLDINLAWAEKSTWHEEKSTLALRWCLQCFAHCLNSSRTHLTGVCQSLPLGGAFLRVPPPIPGTYDVTRDRGAGWQVIRLVIPSEW